MISIHIKDNNTHAYSNINLMCNINRITIFFSKHQISLFLIENGWNKFVQKRNDYFSLWIENYLSFEQVHVLTSLLYLHLITSPTREQGYCNTCSNLKSDTPKIKCFTFILWHEIQKLLYFKKCATLLHTSSLSIICYF